MKRIRSVVRGVGSYLPKRVHDESRPREARRHVPRVDRAAHRHRAAPHRRRTARPRPCSGTRAARAALADAGLEPADIDLIICATSTPDYTFPSTATMIQTGSASRTAPPSTCRRSASGFVYAVSTADKFLDLRLAQARARDRRRNVLAHPRLEGPHHLRALRRRRGRHRAGSKGRRGHQCRPWRADVASALRRTLSRQALRRWRPRLDEDHRRAEDGGQARSSASPSAWSPT